MFPRIICKGFEIDPRMLVQLKSELVEFLEYCPDDSTIDVKIVREGELYQAVTRVYFTGGGFTVKTDSDNFPDVIRSSMDKLYREIESWRKYRTMFLDETTQTEPKKLFVGHEPHILIVDDELGSTKILETCLHDIGCKTTVVTTGGDAVREMMSKSYDLIFLDWLMPDMTGGEAVEKADSLGGSGGRKEQKVITYSSHERKDLNVPQCQHFQFVDHWTKSTSLPVLFSQIRQAVNQISQTA